MKRTILLGALGLMFLGAGCALQSEKAGLGDGYDAAAMPRPDVTQYVATTNLPDVHFDFDKYDVRLDDAKMLDKSAKWLKENARAQVLIEGHCDERGTSEYNTVLGERRAKAAVNYLVTRGIDARRITVVSYGEQKPQCDGHSEACWKQNRRAHFLYKAD